MNKTTIAIAVAGIMVFSACKEKKTSQDIIATRQEVPGPQAPISMQEFRQTSDVEWMGKNYRVEIVRTPVDSLPMVEDEIGQKYVDNRIVLTIIRPDGTEFFKRAFTKGAFTSYLDMDYRKKGILDAMIFKEVDDDKLEFAVSVGYPQSDDEFIPLKMKVDRDGGLSIKRDEDIDTNGRQEDDV